MDIKDVFFKDEGFPVSYRDFPWNVDLHQVFQIFNLQVDHLQRVFLLFPGF